MYFNLVPLYFWFFLLCPRILICEQRWWFIRDKFIIVETFWYNNVMPRKKNYTENYRQYDDNETVPYKPFSFKWNSTVFFTRDHLIKLLKPQPPKSLSGRVFLMWWMDTLCPIRRKWKRAKRPSPSELLNNNSYRLFVTLWCCICINQYGNWILHAKYERERERRKWFSEIGTRLIGRVDHCIPRGL